MSLKQLMDAISIISQTASARDEELHKKHGLDLGLTMGDPASIAYLSEARETSTPLINYLEKLAPEDVKKLVTVMYAGRDVSNFKDAGSLRTFHADLKIAGVHDKEKSAYIRIISEKIMNLAHYFKSASDLSAEMGIDIDADLSHVR